MQIYLAKKLKKIMGSRERILQFVEYKKISKNKFYKETGLSNGFLDKNNHPGADKLERIIYTYPDISPEWLLTGRGNMLRSTTKVPPLAASTPSPAPVPDKPATEVPPIVASDTPAAVPCNSTAEPPPVAASTMPAPENDIHIYNVYKEMLDKILKDKDAQLERQETIIEKKDAEIKELHCTIGGLREQVATLKKRPERERERAREPDMATAAW
jgi:hypothetical protein